ncbi:MAG: hypothetical protein H7X85_04950, partial [Thermoanaerobaculia bacterium]|nr:hypothetical protein [Thermoanaerobaculia bacterium]
ALSRLEAEGRGDLARARLLVVGSRVLWARSDREVVDLLKEGQLVLVFALGETVEETAGAVNRMKREARREHGPAGAGRRARRSV